MNKVNSPNKVFASKVKDFADNSFAATSSMNCFVWGHNCGFISYDKDSTFGQQYANDTLSGKDSQFYLYDVRIAEPIFIGSFISNFDNTYKDNAIAMNKNNFMLTARKTRVSVYENGSITTSLEKDYTSATNYAKNHNALTNTDNIVNPTLTNWGLFFCATSGTATSDSKDWGRFRSI